MRVFHACLMLGISVGSSHAVGRFTTSTVVPGVPRHVSTDLPRVKLVETTFAAHPRNPDNQVAAAMVLREGRTGVVVYSTHDGGRTWTPGGSAAGDKTREDALDPWVIFTADGTVLLTYLSAGSSNNFAVIRSTDGGRTWSSPTFVPGGLYDRQYLAEDASDGSKYKGRVYALGKINVNRLGGLPFQAIAVSESVDGAVTFSPPRLFVPPDDGGDPLWIVAGGLTTRTGKLVVPFATVLRPNATDTTLRYTLWTTESADGGRTFSAPSFVGRRLVSRKGLQQVISVPSVAIDRSDGIYDDRLYLAWSVAHNEGHAVQIWRSESSGRKWSDGVTVNDNTRPAGHVNPSVAANASGALAVAWYDRRGDPGNTCHSLFVAASLDGGETFSPNVPAASTQTCVSSGRFANVGDTLGLASDAGGQFHAAVISGKQRDEMQLYVVPFTVQRTSGAADRPKRSMRECACGARLAPVPEQVARCIGFVGPATGGMCSAHTSRRSRTIVSPKIRRASY